MLKAPGQTQLSEWSGAFGRSYTRRNDLPLKEMEAQSRWMVGKTYRQLFSELLDGVKLQRALEVGCNIGKKLEILSKVTNAELYGIEPQSKVVESARQRLPRFQLLVGNAYNLPFKDKYMDLVFTAGVLIHVPPQALPLAISEMYRVSGKYIMGLEFWDKKLTPVQYRGKGELLWKTDFPREFLKAFPDLKLVKEIVLPYRKEAFGKSGLFLNCYLLEKRPK